MWVLTIPTFQWVKVHTRPGGIYGHTCHAVGENLIVVGGMQTNDAGGNVNNCSNHMPAEIFSLVEMEYTGIFDAAGASRAPPVPSDVVKLIGGTAAGGAYVTKPQVWSDLYLQFVFNPLLPRPPFTPTYTLTVNYTTTNATSTPTPTPEKTSHVGVAAGAAVGGFVFLALLATIIFLLITKRKAAASQHPGPQVADAEFLHIKTSKMPLPSKSRGTRTHYISRLTSPEIRRI